MSYSACRVAQQLASGGERVFLVAEKGNKRSMLPLLPVACAAFLAPPKVDLPRSNQQASILGSRGPPVVFSSGLFGLMPRHIYSSLFAHLQRSNLTLVVPTGMGFVTRDVVDEVAEAIGVEQVGFLSHSSFDVDILRSPHVGAAVLCDPVAMPTLALSGLSSPDVQEKRARILLAGEAYEAKPDGVAIPEYLCPHVHDDSEVTVFPLMGHADLLDDTWAQLGLRALPWMRTGAPSRVVPRLVCAQRVEVSRRRDAYRTAVAAAAALHLG